MLVGGNREERLDGSALTRHAKYGFGDVPGLFGRDLVSQIELKVVAGSPLLDQGGLMLVDSPGMIDPPGTASPDRSDTDRGYDFKRVVQWFADRADVILVMFDPDKPGTTFETLDVLTSSLNGLSSKVLLILNKVDDFATVHDFARAYGALCWNLSKVIPRKDLPFIYTMYVPQHNRSHATPPNSNAIAPREDPDDDVKRMLEHEFDGIRGEVIREVERAPDRATDNILNLLKTTASRLKMHVTLVNACKKEYFNLQTFWKRVQMAGIVFGVGAASFYIIRTAGVKPIPVIQAEAIASEAASNNASSSSASSSSIAGKNAWQQSWAKKVMKSQSSFRFSTLFKIIVSSCVSNFCLWKASMVSLESKRDQVLQWLPATFARVYSPFLCKSDRVHDELKAQWQAVQPGLVLAFTSAPVDEFPAFDASHTSFLNDVLELHLPRLDRCVRDRTGDDHAYLRFKHLERPSVHSQPEPVLAKEKSA